MSFKSAATFVGGKRAAVTLIAASLLYSNAAMAAFDVKVICDIASWYKTILGAAALIAIFMIVLNSFFGKSAVIAEVLEKVVIGCVVAMAAGAIISSILGTSACSGV